MACKHRIINLRELSLLQKTELLLTNQMFKTSPKYSLTGFTYRGLSPDKFTPVPGVPKANSADAKSRAADYRRWVWREEMKEGIELLCVHCGERFNIGIDSQLVTDEDQIEFLKQIGAAGIIHVGTPTRNPDLAGHCVLDEDQKIANLRKLGIITLDLAQGEQRAWYCDACKRTNDYPKEWHRGTKKEVSPLIQKPRCDVCSKEVVRGTGYILSTSEVTGARNYWKYLFLNYPAHTQAIGNNGKRLMPFVIEKSGDIGAWLVCEECIPMFPFDMARAQQLCRAQWTENGSLVPRQLGPAQWENSLKAAGEGWQDAFGKQPTPDRDDANILLALTIYATATGKWERGSSDSSLVVICASAKTEGKVEEPEQKKWWQIWKSYLWGQQEPAADAVPAQLNMNWYQAESKEKNVRQIVLLSPAGKDTKSRFGMLLLSTKYMPLLSNTWATGFFNMDNDLGPFLMVREDNIVKELRGSPVSAAFCFYRMRAGGLVTMYTHVDCPAVAQRLNHKIALFEMSYGLDNENREYKEIIDRAIGRDSLHICFAQGKGTGQHLPSGGFRSESINAQYDVILPMPPECRAALRKEYDGILSYHSSVPSSNRDYQKSVQQMWTENPQGVNTILPRPASSENNRPGTSASDR
jgi:hypothetical protein